MRLLALLLLTVALAGCFDDDSDAPDPGDGTGTDTSTDTSTGSGTSTDGPTPPDDPEPQRLAMLIEFGWSGCRGAEVRYHPDVATAQAALPEGYTAHGEAPAPEAGAVATVQYLWTECASFDARTTSLNGTLYGHVAVRIDPVGNVSADTHWYRLRMLAEPGIMQQLWTAAGYPVYAEAYNRSLEGAGPLMLRSESLGGYELSAPDGAPDEDVSGTVAYWAEAPSGLLEWTGTIDATRSAAPGTFTVPEGDPFADALAAEPLPPTDTWFHDGSAFTDNDLWSIRSG